MPTARPTRCPIPGCHRLTTQRGRCEEHQPKPWANPSANTRTLTSADRARFRRMVLDRDPVCVCTGWCGTHYGPCTQPATEADHIVPIGLGGAHHAGENGAGLCASCHLEKSKQDNQRIRQARSRRGTP